MTFEYTAVVWRNDDVDALVSHLNALGAEGWEAVGAAPKSWSVPMPGMGADVDAALVIVLKRQR